MWSKVSRLRKQHETCIHFIIAFKINHLSLFITTHDAFDITDPSSVQDAGVSRSSVVRASDRCAEVHGFDSCRGLRFFSLSHNRDMRIITSLEQFLFECRK